MSVNNTLGNLSDRHRLKVALFAIVEDVQHHDTHVASVAIHSLTSLLQEEQRQTQAHPLQNFVFGLPPDSVRCRPAEPTDWKALLEDTKPEVLAEIRAALAEVDGDA